MIYLVYNKEHLQYADKCMNSLIKHGYRYKSLGIPDNPEGLPHGQTINGITYYPKSQWKPFLINGLLDKGDDVTYMDCDIIVNERFDEFMEPDVSITVHDPKIYIGLFPHITASLNAGLIHVKNNGNGKEFVNEWMETMKETKSGSDQEALTIMMDRGFKSYVKTFRSQEYNNTNPDKNNKAKLNHYVGWRKQLLRNSK
jgi:hypothetical protein